MGSPTTDAQWLQAKLPVSLGGLGLRAAKDHAPAAYATSYLTSRPLTRDMLCPAEEMRADVQNSQEEPLDEVLPQALLTLLSVKQGEEATTEFLRDQTQKEISFKIDKNNQKLLSDLLSELGSDREKARLNSLSLPQAGAWLNVIPSPSICLHLRPLEFTTMLKYRLSCPVY